MHHYAISDNQDREFLTSIARVRELGLEKSKLARSCLDELIPDRHSSMARATFKAQVVRDLDERAEALYEVTVRTFAMSLMEHDRSLSSAQAMAAVEGMILEVILA
jgi:hypothetical protein